MKTLNELKLEVQNTIRGRKKAYDVQVNQLLQIEIRWEQRLCSFYNKLPLLVQVLEKEGLAIDRMNFRKSGHSENWGSDDVLVVDVNAVPTSKKFRFIKFGGYLSNGRGRNQNRLNERAAMLAESIKNFTNLNHVQVNPVSLQFKQKDEKKSVLITICV